MYKENRHKAAMLQDLQCCVAEDFSVLPDSAGQVSLLSAGPRSHSKTITWRLNIIYNCISFMIFVFRIVFWLICGQLDFRVMKYLSGDFFFLNHSVYHHVKIMWNFNILNNTVLMILVLVYCIKYFCTLFTEGINMFKTFKREITRTEIYACSNLMPFIWGTY